MFPILGSLLSIETLDIAGLLAYFGWRRQTERRDLLRYPKNNPKRLWVIDQQLAGRVGPTTKVQQQTAKRAVTAARWLVHTRAFEHLVLGLINPKSRWHTKKPVMNASVRTSL
jgi:hypothetical protein